MERNENETIPKILDFNIDWWDAVKKLEAILCTNPWNKHLNVYGKEPNETKLMIDLLREGAIDIGEVYLLYAGKVHRGNKQQGTGIFALFKQAAI